MYLLLLSDNLGAQELEPKCTLDCSCDMAGKVLDRLTKEPLPYATVQLKGSSVGTIADENGVFHLHNLCEDEFDLVVSYVGYKSVVHHHDLYHTDPAIYLSPLEEQLEGIVVEGVQAERGMASASSTTLGPKELESKRGATLGDVLKELPGVTTISTGQNVVKPVVHGLHSSRVLIINNGLRHESQSWGVEHAPEIDPAQADNIRLIKGAASVKYGPGALGGVILVNPPQPRLLSKLNGSADINLQSNGRSVGGSALVQEGYSRFAWIAQAAGLYQGDLHTPDYVLSNTGARELSFSAGALYHKKQLDLNLSYSYFGQKLGILRGSVTGNLRDLAFAIGNEPPAETKDFTYTINTPYQQVSHHLLKLKGTYAFDNSTLDILWGFQANQRQEFDVRRGTDNPLPSINLQLFTNTLEAEWKHPVWGAFSGSTGIQAQYQDNNNIPGTNTTPFIPNYQNLNLGVFVTESIALGKAVVDAGIRYDQHYASVAGRNQQQEIFRSNLRYQSITASTGFIRPLSAWSSIQSNLGLAWRPPNMAELYSFGKHEAAIEYGLWRFYNDSTGVFTQAEKAVNSELSYKWVNTYSYQKGNTALELTAYINYIQNYIYNRPVGITTTTRGTFPLFIYDQTNTLLAGVDGSLVVKHNDHWASGLKFMFLQASDVKSGERFVGLPPNRLSYTLDYNRNSLGRFRNFTSGFKASYVFEQYQAPPVIPPEEIIQTGGDDIALLNNTESGFDFLAAPNGYFLLNFSSAIEKGPFTYRLNIRNLLNTSYRDYTNRLRYFADEPGRNFVLTVKYAF